MPCIVLDHAGAARALATHTLPAPEAESVPDNLLAGSAAQLAEETGCEVDEIERMAEDMGFMFEE